MSTLQERVLPYAALLIAPLTACLSSSDATIRAEGTTLSRDPYPGHDAVEPH